MINDEARKEIQKISDKLSSISGNCNYTSQYSHEADKLLTNSDINWKFNSGKRIICGISKTINGERLTDDLKPCVVKFETHSQNWNPKKNHNQREIEIWKKARNTGNTKYIGNILDHAVNGQWLVMQEYVPVFEDQIRNIQDQTILRNIGDYLIKNEDFTIEFKSVINKSGIYPHDLKGGNIGYNKNKDRYVLIDYGSSISYQKTQ